MTETTPAKITEVRHQSARLIARFFLQHLLEEVKKSDAILQEDFVDIPVRDMTYKLITRVRHEFGIPESESLPSYNLFERWCELNGRFTYADSGFVGFNHLYLPRLLDLRDGTPESQQRHFSAMRATFDRFDYEKRGFTVSFFLDSESIVRELMRQEVREGLASDQDLGERIVMAQSRAYATAMCEYFEGVLRKTLAENVRLLQGILPQQVAGELKRNGFVEPVSFADAAVIFTDFENFSQFTARMAPAEVIRRLDAYFTEFDRICAVHGLEKIKTIGDSYMAVAGVPEPQSDPVRAACHAALEIAAASRNISDLAGPYGWEIRIGVHTGPLVAGVIGKQKFSYDVWGATVNLASRMESAGEPGRINVSAEVHARVKPYFQWESRGSRPVKRLGEAEMFFLLGKV